MPGWFDGLVGVVAAPEGLAEWAASQPSLDAARRDCPRADWAAWLAAADARSDEERREIVAGAASLAAPSTGLRRWLFRLRPNALDRAQLWAAPCLIDDIDVVTADWLHGVLLALVVVVPVAAAMMARSSNPGAARSIFRSDLITIPVAVVVSFVAYVLFRRWRRSFARAGAAFDYPRALSVALAALEQKVAKFPGRAASDAKTFRLRMERVREYTRTE